MLCVICGFHICGYELKTVVRWVFDMESVRCLLLDMFNGCFTTVDDNRVENMCAGVNLSSTICQLTLFHWNRLRKKIARGCDCFGEGHTSGTLGLL